MSGNVLLVQPTSPSPTLQMNRTRSRKQKQVDYFRVLKINYNHKYFKRTQNLINPVIFLSVAGQQLPLRNNYSRFPTQTNCTSQCLPITLRWKSRTLHSRMVKKVGDTSNQVHGVNVLSQQSGASF